MDIEKSLHGLWLRPCVDVTFHNAPEHELFDELAPPFSRFGLRSARWPYWSRTYQADKYPLKRKASYEVLGEVAAGLSLETTWERFDDTQKIMAEGMQQTIGEFFVGLAAKPDAY